MRLDSERNRDRTLLLETFLFPSYLNTIQTSCPWVLRYLAAAAILSRKAAAGVASAAAATSLSSHVRHAIKKVVKVIQMEEYQYTDPITSFLKELYIKFDFEAAHRELTLTEEVVGNDFFLSEFEDKFLDNARYLISEAYCRIHQKINIANLSERLNLSQEEGEKWIVNLFREARMGADAKIDLEKVRHLFIFHFFLCSYPIIRTLSIKINRPPQLVYQNVIEKTCQLAVRTRALGVAMAR